MKEQIEVNNDVFVYQVDMGQLSWLGFCQLIQARDILWRSCASPFEWGYLTT